MRFVGAFIGSLWIHGSLVALVLFLSREIPHDRTALLSPSPPRSQRIEVSLQRRHKKPSIQPGKSIQPEPLVESLSLGTFDIAEPNSHLRGSYVPPEYPLAALRRRIQGRVLLEVTVTKGQVEDVRVFESSGHRILDDAAIKAVKQWRYFDQAERKFYQPIAFQLSSPSALTQDTSP